MSTETNWTRLKLGFSCRSETLVLRMFSFIDALATGDLNKIGDAYQDILQYTRDAVKGAINPYKNLLEQLPNPIYYDTHGWFTCQQCHTTSYSKSVALPNPKPGYPVGYLAPTDDPFPQPGYPVGYLAPTDDPFPHKETCYYFKVTKFLKELE